MDLASLLRTMGGSSSSGQSAMTPAQASSPSSLIQQLISMMGGLGNAYSSGMGSYYNAASNNQTAHMNPWANMNVARMNNLGAQNVAQIQGEQKLAGLRDLLAMVNTKMPAGGSSGYGTNPYNISTNYGAGVGFGPTTGGTMGRRPPRSGLMNW